MNLSQPTDQPEPNQPLVCPDVQERDLRSLASAVVTQAIRDLIEGTDGEMKDAFLWLLSLEFEGWAEWSGFYPPNPYLLLTNLKQIRKLLKLGRSRVS